MAARGAEHAPQSPDGHNTYVMSSAVTLERNKVVKYDSEHSFDMPRLPIAEKLDSRQSGLHRRTSPETRSEREIQDLLRDTKEVYLQDF